MNTGKKGSKWLSGLIGSVILSLAGVYAYCSLFTLFRAYDDEGLVIYAIQHFLSGHALYDEYRTQYGPAFYFLNALLFLPKFAVTHNSGRLISLLFWFVGSVLIGIVTRRLTSNTLAGAIAFLSAIVISSTIANEPGHPQAMIFVLCSTGMLLSVGRPSTKTVLGLGAVVGTLCAIKVNIGCYFGLAYFWVLASYIGRFQGKSKYVGLFGCALGTIPLLLMRDTIHDRMMAVNLIVSTIAILNLVMVTLVETGSLRPMSTQHIVQFVASCLIVFWAFCAYAMFHGTSISGLYYGIVAQHLGFAQEFFKAPPYLGGRRIGLIVCSAPCLASYLWLIHRWPVLPDIVDKLLAAVRLAFGFVVVTGALTTWELLPYAITWMWLGMLDTRGRVAGGNRGFCRRTLLSLATFLYLQCYPVAGSQWQFTLIGVLPLGLVCIFDGLHEICRSGFNGSVPTRHSIAPWLPASALLLTVAYFAIQTYDKVIDYFGGVQPLALSGASLLRLPERQASHLETITLNARWNARNLFTQPGMYSFCIWSGVDTPGLQNQTNWPIAFRDNEQRRLVELMERGPATVVIRNKDLTRFWEKAKLRPQGPAVEFIATAFDSAVEVGGYEVLARPEKPPPFQPVAAQWVDQENNASHPTVVPNRSKKLMIRIPPVSGSVHSVAIVDARVKFASRIEFVTSGPFHLVQKTGQVDVVQQVELDEWRTFAVDTPALDGTPPNDYYVARLMDANQNVILRLSILASAKPKITQ